VSDEGGTPAVAVDQGAGPIAGQSMSIEDDGLPELEEPTVPGGLRSLLRAQAVDTRPLAVVPYRRLLVGQGTSFIGSMLTQVAVPVQVYRLSGSSLDVGLVGLVSFVPLVVFGLYGGAVADAVDRRTLYFIASLGTWAVTLGLLLQSVLGVHSVALILGLIAVQSATFAMAGSARGAIIPRIVPKELVPAANTLNFTVGNIGQVLGPLIAGVLVSLPNGFTLSYSTDAVLFTAALYTCFRLPKIPPQGDARAGALGLRSVVEGLQFIGSNPVLLMSFGVDIVAMVFAMPNALYPQIAAERFGNDVGPLYAAIAIGAVIAGLASGWVGRVKRQGRALTFAVVGWGVAIAVSGFAHALWLMVILLAFAGAADFVSAVYRQTILQTYAPDEMRGRMQGVFIAVVAGGPRLGQLRAGATAAAAGATFSWVAGGVACIVVVLIAGLAVRPFWRYNTQDKVDADALAAVRSSEPGVAVT
jgi:MFS family permease